MQEVSCTFANQRTGYTVITLKPCSRFENLCHDDSESFLQVFFGICRLHKDMARVSGTWLKKKKNRDSREPYTQELAVLWCWLIFVLEENEHTLSWRGETQDSPPAVKLQYTLMASAGHPRLGSIQKWPVPEMVNTILIEPVLDCHPRRMYERPYAFNEGSTK